MTNAALSGKPEAVNPHVRFDEREVASVKPPCGSSLCKRLNLALTALATAGLALSADAALTAKSYVAPGLIGLWDGIENVSYGAAHDSAATTWKDLTGQSFNIGKPANSHFEADGLATLRLSGSDVLSNADWTKTKMYAAYKATAYTCEIAFNQTNAVPKSSQGWGNQIMVMLTLGHANRLLGGFGNTLLGFNPVKVGHENGLNTYKTLSTTVGQHSFSCRQDGTAATVTADGASTTASVTVDTPETGHGFRFNKAYYSDYGMNGTYHVIRFYDRALTEDEVAVNRAVDAVRYFGKSTSEFTLPSGWRWSGEGGDVALEHQYAFSVEPTGGGLVSVDDGTSAASGSYWVEQGVGTQKKLVATANDGYAFLGWVGDGLTDAQKINPTLTATVVGSITAVFRKTDGTDPRTYTWQGTGVWADAMSWRDEDGIPGVPAANDSVVIAAKKTALLTNATPKYAALTVSGTLSLTNWETCVKADTVTVANGGKVTVAGKSTDKATNRVWIVCTDCMIATGGSIDVNDLGFRGSPQTDGGGGGKASYVSGPGKGNAENRGASHGGHGAYSGARGLNKSAFQNRLPYDDPQKPVLPGSGGYPQAWGPGTDGGGAVYISAAKSVTVNGAIKASVTKTVSYRGTCGSGGAVLIECETFHGKNGSIAADGGGSSSTTATIVNDGYHGGAPGGGGCIAVKYDPTKQTGDMITNLTMSAASGYWNSKKAFGDENERMDAGLGTLYFPDNKLLKVLLASGLSGALVNCSDYAWNGDLVFGKGHLRLASEGVKFKVDGNLSVTGKMTRLEIGGVTITNQCTVNGIWAGRQTNILDVAGAVTIEKGGRLDLHAAETNKNIAIGAYLKVGGRLSVAANSTLSCWSDQVNMGSPFIEADSFQLAEGGLVTGYMRGCGPGKGIGGGYDASGGSHGGRSGYALNNHAPKKPYDDEYLPVMPGSGGANGSWAAGGPGGGVVYISVANDATVNGTINVDGMSAQGSHTGGAGAGGTIQIRCRTFAAGENAVMTAKGGNGLTHGDVGGGSGGGGGRIAIWCGEPWEPNLLWRRVDTNMTAYAEEFVCATTNINVDGGIATCPGGTYVRANTTADPGTIRFMHVRKRHGFAILVR